MMVGELVLTLSGANGCLGGAPALQAASQWAGKLQNSWDLVLFWAFPPGPTLN